MNQQPVETIEINLLLDAIFRRYGYDFRHYTPATVRRRVERILTQYGCDQISDLIPRLLHDASFAHDLIHQFSITVTEMFRDPSFYRALREQVIPYLQTFPFIKVWHAGCATGEEVYSLAILLQEEGLYDRATIFATDFNEAALRQARDGVYPLKEMRRYTENYQKSDGRRSFADYYHANYELVQMNRDLQRNITFAHHNLVTDSVFSEVHLILCRNVLIYFDRTLQNRVAHLLSDSLIHGGMLCLGTKESLQFLEVWPAFRPVDEKMRIYQKQG